MSETKGFVASPEAKGKAKQLRLYAILAWVAAMALQVFSILKLISDETLIMMIVAIVVILGIAIVGSTCWKKSNKLDPTSEKNGLRFFVQNQLGAIMGILCFLPMVIMIFTSNTISGKTKAIAGSAASVAMTAAGISGVEFDAASIEKYTKEINQQTETAKSFGINTDNVYWLKEGTKGNKYHSFNDCRYLKGKSVSNGSIKDSWEQKGSSELCKVCQKKSAKAAKSIKTTEKKLEPVGN